MQHSAFRLTICGVLLILVACAPQPGPTQPSPPVSSNTGQPHPPRIEEITFQSGSFGLVGDLRLPEGSGPFPVVLFVHGSGPTDRTASGMYLPIMERMLRAGYATFAWDKPGMGESTGQLISTCVYHQRAQIVLHAVGVMKAHPDIDLQQIGLWGISQASYMMPRVLSLSEDIAFTICVSCGGMAGVDETAYHIISEAFCAGVPEETADTLRRVLSELDRARTFETYDEYVHDREVLDALAGMGAYTPDYDGLGVIPKEAWQVNHPEYERSWNPIEVIEQARIPILAIFGDRDTNGDPIQRAYAWKKALEQAGNPDSRVEIIPGADTCPACRRPAAYMNNTKRSSGYYKPRDTAR